ncbi:transcriptional regulator [Noviherbaspirillum humi]|uniref:transcriptional regulator n=1 Tax=Noviherbaspirillum humi TaxID=1688639 RepID=UPI000B76CB51|nr:helix-turn-helix domain-containing protein [Noviherbaspirillum humi]
MCLRTEHEALKEAISIVGSATALAAGLGITKGAVSQWKESARKVPAEHCPGIERLTNGAVRCEELRPDVDWGYIRASITLPSKDAP